MTQRSPTDAEVRDLAEKIQREPHFYAADEPEPPLSPGYAIRPIEPPSADLAEKAVPDECPCSRCVTLSEMAGDVIDEPAPPPPAACERCGHGAGCVCWTEQPPPADLTERARAAAESESATCARCCGDCPVHDAPPAQRMSTDRKSGI